MKDTCLRTARLCISPRTLEELLEEATQETNPEMKQAFTEMYENMKSIKDRPEFGSDWKICLPNGQIVGGLCFKGEPNENGEVEIGYGIEEAFQHQGYATEAVGAVTAWALSEAGVTCVVAETEPLNEISQKVLLKNGFVCEGDGVEGPRFCKYLTAGKDIK